MASKKRQDNVLSIIHDRLVPDEEAKKARGEVFTPLPLVREMLFGMRKSSLLAGKQEVWGVDENGECIEDNPDDRVGGIPLDLWRDPATKWLDPANGIGNFPVATFYMLDYQLGKHGPSTYRGDEHKQTRRKHIVEKMLYMIEFNKGNVNTARKIFKLLAPTAESNICCADTLKMTDAKLNDVFKVNRFDVIMQNPPFNSGGSKIAGDSDVDNPWPEFHKLGYDLLSKNGFSIFIHPSIWRVGKLEATVEVRNRVMASQVVYMRMIEKDMASDKDKHIRFKDADVRVDCYLIQKKEPSHNTHITDIFGNYNYVDISKEHIPFIPNAGFDILHKLYALSKLHPLRINASQKLKERTATKYITHMSDTRGMSVSVEPNLYKNVEHIKICLPGATTRWPVYFVDKGEFMSDRYILMDSTKDAQKQASFLSSKLINFMIFVCHYEVQARVPIELFQAIPDLTDMEINTSDDSDIYRRLGIRREDVTLIESLSQIKRKELAVIDSGKPPGKTRKAKKSEASKEPDAAVGGAGRPPLRRSPYPSRTRRNRRGRREGV